ncbi:MAG TPA: hypothetical protein VE783_03960 [Candidatus Limnocylindrales bacterium]|nr:hypothetical protein [Candidatus Limnocylindrales bacterium]
MNSGLKVSNGEVWAAIAYLDPELEAELLKRRDRIRYMRLKAGIALVSIGALGMAAILRYLPAVARIFN